MAVQVFIESITGKSPFDIYICQVNNSNCLYVDRITETSYSFFIPFPYDNLNEYMLKIVDANNSYILGTGYVE
jgi:hypothetical protein